ncbi:hypothetical protein [Bosea sp. (in: a-proteobacteria)]|uniref:hypothetical protein n=1 Tax=Bosea sp. (in: a-proteobacteria) TaxID=1871050 RepID=UPI003B3B9215
MSTLTDTARAAVTTPSLAALAAAVTEPNAPQAITDPTPPAPPAPAPAPAAAAPTAPLDAAGIRAEARTAERDRIKAIMAHPEAEGRAGLASHLAFSTDLAPDAAGSILATSPKAEAPRTLTGATVPQPNVKPQASDPAPGDAKADAKSRLAAARMAVTGQKA